jgi:hypothetical protein
MTAALAVPTAAPVRIATVHPAPRREPPFDDELPRHQLCLVRGRDRELPFPEPPAADGGTPATRRADLPDPAAWGRRLLIGITETAAGRRPLNQVAALLAPPVHRGLILEFERAAALGCRHWLHAAIVRSVRVSEPGEGVAELSATLQTAGRVRALALRLEAQHGRWRCTSLQIG